MEVNSLPHLSYCEWFVQQVRLDVAIGIERYAHYVSLAALVRLRLLEAELVQAQAAYDQVETRLRTARERRERTLTVVRQGRNEMPPRGIGRGGPLWNQEERRTSAALARQRWQDHQQALEHEQEVNQRQMQAQADIDGLKQQIDLQEACCAVTAEQFGRASSDLNATMLGLPFSSQSCGVHMAADLLESQAHSSAAVWERFKAIGGEAQDQRWIFPGDPCVADLHQEVVHPSIEPAQLQIRAEHMLGRHQILLRDMAALTSVLVEIAQTRFPTIERRREAVQAADKAVDAVAQALLSNIWYLDLWLDLPALSAGYLSVDHRANQLHGLPARPGLLCMTPKQA